MVSLRIGPIFAALFLAFGPAFVAAQTNGASALPTTETQSFSFSGTVRDREGKPLPGISIGLLFRRPGIPPSAPADKTVETGPDGSYRFESLSGVANARILFRASGKGFASQSKSPPLWPSASGSAVVDFVMQPARWVRGRVIGENRVPLSGVRVRVQSVETTTTADGSFLLEGLDSSPAPLTVWPNGSAPPFAKDIRLDQDVEIVLKAPSTIRGRVKDAISGQAITSFTVFAAGPRAGDSIDGPIKSFQSPDGRFALENVDRNSPVWIQARVSGYSASDAGTRIQVDEIPPDEMILALKPLRPLTVVAVDKGTSVAVAGATVYWGSVSAGLSIEWDSLISRAQRKEGEAAAMSTDSSGRVEIKDGDAASGILVRAKGYSDRTVLARDRDRYILPDGRLVLPLAPAASICGVAWLDGKIAAARKVHLTSRRAMMQEAAPGLQNAAGVSLTTTTDSQGQFRFENLSPAVYSLSISATPGTPSQNLMKQVVLREGRNQIVNFGEGLGNSALFGTVRINGRPAPGLRIWAEPRFAWEFANFQETTNADGEYWLLGLRSGEYRITISPDPGIGGSTAGTFTDSAIVGAELTRRDFEIVPPLGTPRP